MIWLGPGLTLPEALAERLAGYRLRTSFQGDAASTFRLAREGNPTVFLKRRADPEELQPLAVEQFVLHRLARTGLPVPRAVHYTRLEDTEYLIVTEVPGRNLVEALEAKEFSAEQAVQVLAAAIARIHAATPDWPEEINAIPSRIEHARARVRDGCVDVDDFEPEHAGSKPADILAEFERRWREPAPARAIPSTRVFVHNDLCLPNVLVHQGQLSGLVDWGRAGYGEPYQDLALAARSLAHNLGEGDWAARLAAACGIADLDRERLALWVLFDELF